MTIGNDVWFARSCTVMPGVTIGDGACIATFALVTRDVPPYAIVGGNPAKLIHRRFPDRLVERLLALGWWNWPPERIRRHYLLMLSDRIEDFLDAAEAEEASGALPDG